MKPISYRTPDKLHAGDVVRFDGFHLSEVVQRIHELPTGAYLVRTSRNLHHCHGDLLVEVVVETWINGIGFVVPVSEDA